MTLEQIEKNCAFQFATSGHWTGVKIYENTDLITLDEAKELYKKYFPQFIRSLENEQNPEMVIWINMKTGSDYGDSLVYLDSSYETDGTRVWKSIKKYAEPELK